MLNKSSTIKDKNNRSIEQQRIQSFEANPKEKIVKRWNRYFTLPRRLDSNQTTNPFHFSREYYKYVDRGCTFQ